jgi:NAD(P)-dependent dehydrogenase (short-subunit alcohol dehydrogenase family)
LRSGGQGDSAVRRDHGGRHAARLESFDTAIAVHVRGALAHLKHVSALMRARRQGSIVNIGSVAGHRAGYSSSLGYGVATRR